MKKFLKKLGIAALGLLMLATPTYASINNSISTQSYMYLSGSGLVANDSYYELGTSGTPWAKIYAEDFDVAGLFTFGGVMMSDLDLNGYDLLNAANVYTINDLTTTATGSGSALIGIEDAGDYYAGTDIEAALQALGGATGSSSGTTWQDPVLDKDLATPPVSPTEGDRYIISNGGDWYDAAWSYRREITIDYTKVPADQTNFVVYFAINTTDNLFSNANADGSDILFTEDDGMTLLPYDLELYDSGTENMTAWVRMELSSSVDTTFYMYYGNALASSLEDVDGTWTDWGGETTIFNSVYHMDESAEDSTLNNYDFTTSQFDGTVTTGTGAYGYEFQGDGSSAWIIKNTTTPANFREEMIEKSFIYLFTTGGAVTSSKEVLHAEGGTTNGFLIYLDGDGATQDLYARWWSAGTGYTRTKLSSGVGTGTTYVLNAQYEYPGNTTLYLNGAEVDTPATANTRTVAAHYAYGGIGGNYNLSTKTYHDGNSASNFYFNGNIHEAWQVNDYPDADWNTTLYNNLLDTSNFFTIGAESSGGASGVWAGHEQEITEYASGVWVYYVPASGWATIVIDENLQYVFDGGAVWTPLTSSLGHNYLSGLDGGDSGLSEYYHLSSDEYDSAIRDATQTLNGLMPAGKLDNWDSAFTSIIQYFTLDDASDIDTDGNGYYLLSGSGATTTGSGTATNEIVLETSGEYDLGNEPLFLDNSDGSDAGYQIKGTSFGGAADVMKVVTSTDGQVVVLDEINKDSDPGITQTAYPQLTIYSDANWVTEAQDQFIRFYHDQTNGRILSGTGNLIISPTGAYYTQIGAGGGCAETVGSNDFCISGVTEMVSRLVVDDDLRVKVDAEVWGDLSVTGTGTFQNGLMTSGQPNDFQNYSHFGFSGVGIDGDLSVTGTGAFNGISIFNQTANFNGKTYFNSNATFTGNAIFQANSRHDDDKILRFGTSNDAGFVWDTVQTNDTLLLGLSGGNSLVLTPYTAIGSDFTYSTENSPTLIITGSNGASNPNQYIKFRYEQMMETAFIQTGTGNIVIQPDSGLTSFSSSPVTLTHTLVSDSVHTAGDIEIDGIGYFDDELQVTGTGTYSGLSYFNNDSIYQDDAFLNFGDSEDASIAWDTSQTKDSLIIGVGATSKTMIITEQSLLGTDLGFSDSPYPALVMTSSNIAAASDEWIQLGFSPLGANFRSGSGSFVFELGTGALVTVSNLPPASPSHALNENSLWARGDLYAENDLYVDGISYFSGTGTFNGAMVYNFTDVSSATYTLASDDRMVGVSYTATGTGTITIPSAFISVSGWTIDIKDSGFNASVYPVVIETEGAETIDGNANLSIIGDGNAYTLVSDGTNLLIY